MNKRLLHLSILLSFITTSSFAVKTQYWKDTTSKDFKAGKLKHLIISNRGKLRLGLQEKILLSGRKDVSIIFSVAKLPNNKLVVATGPEGKVLIREKDAWKTLFQADQPYIYSLAVGKTGKLYIGTGGSMGKVYEYDTKTGKSKLIFKDKSVNYIWDLLILPTGKLLAATGPTGKLIEITKTGSKCIFQAKRQRNLLALSAISPDTVYVGTDTHGLVYRIKLGKDKVSAEVVFDADEPEISDIIVTKDYIYVATAGSKQAHGQARAYLKSQPGKPLSQKSSKKPKSSKIYQTTIQEKPQLPKPPMILPPVLPPAVAKTPPKGGAVYRIDRLGFVKEIFRDKVNIHSIEFVGECLYLATGPDGIVYQIKPDNEEVAIYAKFKVNSILKVESLSANELIIATLSPAKLIKLGPSLASTGEYTSKVFDASQLARWGTIEVILDENSPVKKGGLSIQVRTSMVRDPDDPAWSEWSKPTENLTFHIPTPPARFLQYKLTFKSVKEKSPVVGAVKIAYMQDNLPPKISSISVQTGSSKPTSRLPIAPPKPSSSASYKVTWKASDPNGDSLTYSIYIKSLDSPYWIELKKDITQTNYALSPKLLPDGKYEVKIIASDKKSNPQQFALTDERKSDVFVIDNTPPTVENLTCKVDKTKLYISAKITDSLSNISGAWVSINASPDWLYIAPADELYDSKSELIDVEINLEEKTKADIYVITLKVQDLVGNIVYKRQLIKSD